MKLLFAEDERSLSQAITHILEKNCYSVDAVYDGQAALEYLENGDYDGVILTIIQADADLAGFILRRVFPQLRPIGQCIVSDLQGISLIRFHFSDRVIAKVMDQHCIDNTNEETGPFQLQRNGPPVHTGMLHDDAHLTTNRV